MAKTEALLLLLRIYCVSRMKSGMDELTGLCLQSISKVDVFNTRCALRVCVCVCAGVRACASAVLSPLLHIFNFL